jgi:Tfp pilus assembly protein PilO
MIDRLSKRTAVAIAAVGVLAVVLVGWFALVSPQRSKATELDGKISESHTALQLADALTRSGEQRQTAAEARVLVKAMPSNSQMSQILRQLSSAAKATRVRVTSVTPQASAPLAGYEAVPMAVVVEGRYLGIANFLGRLRTQVRVGPEKVRATGRLYSVDSMQFVVGADQKLLQATITLNAYRFGGSAATPANAGTSPATSGTTSATPAPTQ